MFYTSRIDGISVGLRYVMKELTSVNRAKQVNTMQSPAIHLLQPSDMIEELMYHIMWNEFDGKLDPNHKYFPLYLSLQQLLEDETKRLEEWTELTTTIG